MEWLPDLVPYIFLLFYLACGVACVVRFRGSPAAVLGAIAFGIWAALNIFNRVRIAQFNESGEPGSLDDLARWIFPILGIAAYGCLLSAILTARVHGQALVV